MFINSPILKARYSKLYNKMNTNLEIINRINELLENKEELKKLSSIHNESVEEYTTNIREIKAHRQKMYNIYYDRLFKLGIKSHRNSYPNAPPVISSF